ncbi:MAG: SBBP repeat-containing protein [Pirellulales bacterium]
MHKHLFVTVIVVLFSRGVGAQPYPEEWFRQFGTSTESGQGVATDTAGNVIVVGYSLGGTLAPVRYGMTDAFVRKYDAAGTELWTKQLGTSESDGARGVAVGRAGEVYVTGYIAGHQGGAFGGVADAFLSKLDSSGQVLWSQQFGVPENDEGRGVTIDRFGNIYVTGYTDGSLGGVNAGGLSTRDAFVAKFDDHGQTLWTKQVGEFELDEGNAIVSDSSGDVYICGRTITGAYLKKLDNAGNLLWSKKFGMAPDNGLDLAVDASDHIYVTGVTVTREDGGATFTIGAFLKKFDTAGNDLWSRNYGAAGFRHGYSVGVDGAGDIFVTGGESESSNDFSSRYDIFLLKSDAAGNLLWSETFGSDALDNAFSLAADPRGDIYVSGYSEGSFQIPNSLAGRAFVIKFANNVPEPCAAMWLYVAGVMAVVKRRRKKRLTSAGTTANV